MELPSGPAVLVAIPAELAQDVADALGLLAKEIRFDGLTTPPKLIGLRGELEAHGRRYRQEQAAREEQVPG